MKRISAKMIACIMLLSSIFSVAVAEKRNVIDYCLLYTNRLYEIRDDYNYDLVDAAMPPFNTPIYDMSSMGAMFTYDKANLFMDTKTYEIDSVSCGFNDSNLSTDENRALVDRFIITLSVLEYGAIEDSQIQLEYKVGLGTARDALARAIEIYDDEIKPKLTDASFQRAMNGEFVDLYKGENYTYTLGRAYGENESYTITARASGM